MRARVRRRVRRRTAPKVRRCPCGGARDRARERMAGAGALMIGGARDPAEARTEERAAQALSAPPARRMCADCAAEEAARRSAAADVVAPGAAVAHAPKTAEAAVNALGPGRPLSVPERGFFEPRLGADLSAVRLHEDAAADRAARAMDARAFTLGSDVAFARGERAHGGAGLMAHELAHAVEDGGAVRRVVSDRSRCPPGPVPQGGGPATPPLDAMDIIRASDARARDLAAECAAELRDAARDPRRASFYFEQTVRAFVRIFGLPRQHGFAFIGLPPERLRFVDIREAIADNMRVVAARHDRIAALLAQEIRYVCSVGNRYRLSPTGPWRDCGRGVMWSNPRGGRVIAICRGAWDELNGVDGVRSGAALFVHEGAHIALHGHGHRTAGAAARHTNAGCYGDFAFWMVGLRTSSTGQCDWDMNADQILQNQTATPAQPAQQNPPAP